jgi:hypothetical protein
MTESRRCQDCELTSPNDARYCVHCGKRLPEPTGHLTAELVLLWTAGSRGRQYAALFERLFPTGEASFKPSWSWAACLVPLWMIYRRLYLAWLLVVATSVLLGVAEVPLWPLLWIGQGLFGNALYFLALERRARRAARPRADVGAHQYG